MASVPNMRLAPTVRPGVAEQPGDGGEGGDFAQLLSTTVSAPAGREDQSTETGASGEDRPATGTAVEPVAQADAILSLVALQATPVTASVPAAATSLDPSSGLPGTNASGLPAMSEIGAGTTPAAAPASVPVAAGVVTVPGGTIDGLPATVPAAGNSTATQPTEAATAGSGSAPGAPSRPATAPDGAPVLTGPGPQPAAPGPQSSDIPLAVRFAATTKAAATALDPAAATVVAAKAGATLVSAQSASTARNAATKVPSVGVATDPAAATAPTVPSRGSGGPPRAADPNSGLLKAEAVAAQAPAQTATPVTPPFVHAPSTEPLAMMAPAAGGPALAGAAEAMIERQLDLAADGEWLDQLARDIAGAGGSEGKMRFRLDPEHLGTLRVELTQSERGTSVRLTVESEAARAIIADAQPKLAAEARAQGVRLAETHVDLAGGHAGDPRRQESERRDPQLRTGRESSSPDETEPRTRSSSDRYA